MKAHYDQPENWIHEEQQDYSRYRSEDDAMWVFEPGGAEKLFEELVAEFKISVYRDEWLDRAQGVEKMGARITAITTLSGKTYRGKMFIDATYEGDLMAAAG